jgi:hypothetical protein
VTTEEEKGRIEQLATALTYARSVIAELASKAQSKYDRLYCESVLAEGNSIDAALEASSSNAKPEPAKEAGGASDAVPNLSLMAVKYIEAVSNALQAKGYSMECCRTVVEVMLDTKVAKEAGISTLAQATPEGGQDLPPLPEFKWYDAIAEQRIGESYFYTADQMRNYARAALAASQQAADQYKVAFEEYNDKTSWVQWEVSKGIIGAWALGMHRADVIKRLVTELRASEHQLIERVVAHLERQSMPGSAGLIRAAFLDAGVPK